MSKSVAPPHRTSHRTDERERIRVSEILAACSIPLDLCEERSPGHALRSVVIGLEIGARLDLPLQDLRDFYYAALLGQAGCASRGAAHLRHGMRLSAAAAADLVALRANRAAEVVQQIGVGDRVADAVRFASERWEGAGQPRGLRAYEIPIAARLLAIAQILDAMTGTHGPALALDVVRARRGKWFDPALSDTARDLDGTLARLAAAKPEALMDEVLANEPGGASVLAGPAMLERIARGYAEIADGKSAFTGRHSLRVADRAAAIGAAVGFDDAALADLRLAALFHDLGKLAAPDDVLDKPAALDAVEERILRRHPRITRETLAVVPGLARVAEAAGAHHERTDGSGYDRGLAGDAIPVAARAIAVADTYDALVNARPYRPALPDDLALRIMERERGALDPDCMDALRAIVDDAHAAGEDDGARAA